MKNLSIAPSVAFLAFALLTCSCSDDSSSSSSTGGSGGTSATGGKGNTGGTTATGGGGGSKSTGGSAGAAGNSGANWVGTWATGLQTTEPRNLPTPADDMAPTPDNPGFAGNTLRQFIHISIGGSKLRLKLSNEYGVTPVTMEAVHIAKSKGEGAIDTSSDKALSFSGEASVTIPAGQAVSSDTFEYAVEPLSNLAITIKFGDQSKDVTGHPGSRTYSYLMTGDGVTEETLTGDPIKTAHWYFISGLDVMADDDKTAAVVVLGDSLTDGRGTTDDGNDRWTDDLARRLQANAATSHIAVLNQGIGGNAVLSGGIGPTAKSRFDHDVLGMPGVKWLIVFEGVNDIGNSTTDISADLIAAFEEFVSKAHNHEIKAFGATITPFKTHTGYDKLDHLAQRTTVNQWILADGHFDAAIDLDPAVGDPDDLDKLREDFATLRAAVGTDYLHLNPAGYQAIADAVDLTLFK